MNPCSVNNPFGQSFRNPLCHCLSSFSETLKKEETFKQKILEWMTWNERWWEIEKHIFTSHVALKEKTSNLVDLMEKVYIWVAIERNKSQMSEWFRL